MTLRIASWSHIRMKLAAYKANRSISSVPFFWLVIRSNGRQQLFAEFEIVFVFEIEIWIWNCENSLEPNLPSYSVYLAKTLQ